MRIRTHLDGTVAPGFEEVRTGFECNFRECGERDTFYVAPKASRRSSGSMTS